MRRARVQGSAAAQQHYGARLQAAGWRLTDRGPVELLVQILGPAADLAALAGELRSLGAGLPAPARDATGELRAPGAVLLIAPSGSLPAAELPGWLAAQVPPLAPKLRINAVLTPAASVENLQTPALDWLAAAPAVTGQLLRLGVGADGPALFRSS